MINLKSRHARRQEVRQIHRIMEASESRLQKLLVRELLRVTDAAASAYPSWEAVLPQHKKNLYQILAPELTRSATASALRAREATKFYFPGMETKLPTQTELRATTSDWARKHAAKKVTEITATTEQRIGNAVADGLSSSDSPDEIARSIREDVGGMSTARARTIARTETSAAVGTAQQDEMEAASEEMGVDIKKTWAATEDAHTRETHLDADGQERDINDSFQVGDAQLDFPGDPSGPPEEVINCRCVALYGVG